MQAITLTAVIGLFLAGSSSLVLAQADPSISAKNPAGVSDNRTDSPAAPRQGMTGSAPSSTGSVSAPAGAANTPDVSRSATNPAGVCDNRTDSPAAQNPSDRPC